MSTGKSTRPAATRYERHMSHVFPDRSASYIQPVATSDTKSEVYKTVTLNLHWPRIRFGFLQNYQLRAVGKFLITARARLALAVIVIILVAGDIMPVFQSSLANRAYALDSSASLLPPSSQSMADKLKYDPVKAVYNFNAGYEPAQPGSTVTASGGARIVASAYVDPTRGIQVTDPVSSINLTMTPKFSLLNGKKQDNRVKYPLSNGNGWLVYTMQADQAKEDILLRSAEGDSMTLEYDLGLGNSLEAHILPNGGIGVYGTSLPLNGNVTTGSAGDAALLQKARTHAKKDKLVFTIPAPIVKQENQATSTVKSHYELKGTHLKLLVSGLSKAQFPLTIDPSVYVESAAKFMQGNNESNVDFDVANSLIEKGKLTGARFESWTSTTALNVARWSGATVVAGGYIYLIGGSSGSTNFGNVYWAKLNTSTYTIDSPDPGNGSCTNWCTNAAYNLPSSQVRRGLSAVAYNGYLFAIGGVDGATCAGTNNVCSTVYKTKLGANGEPISWTATTSLNVARMYAGAVAYNDRIYVTGGQTNTSLNGDTSTEYASINPDGTLGSWTTSGVTMATAVWGHSVLQYNGYLYVVGGSNTATPTNNVLYSQLNSNGTLNSWVTNSTTFTTARASYGGNFATISGGYLYVDGGCSAMTTTNCTTIISAGTAQLASINADGSVSDWTSLTGVTHTLAEQGLVAWRNNLYSIGGCNLATSGSNCTSTGPQTATQYGTIKTDGDVSPKTNETSLPTIGNANGTVGSVHSAVVVNNGYIYDAGGCATLTAMVCTAMSDNVGYAPIGADGSIGAWSVANNILNGTAGVGAGASVVFNNYLYIVGGTDGAGNWKSSIYRSALDPTTGVPGTFTEQTAKLPNGPYGMSYVTARSTNGTAGDLYVMGGCISAGNGYGCGGGYQTDVLRCPITLSTGAIGTCSTTANGNQLQIQDLDGSTAGTQGLGAGEIATWGDYIYLVGGVCGLGTATGATAEANGCDGVSTGSLNTSEISKVYYAKFNSSGNIVRADNGNATGGWQIATGKLPDPNRRGVSFAVNGYVYVAGGHDGTTTTGAGTLSTVAYAKVDPATGDLGTFNSVSQGGSTNNIITARWGHGYAAANGYLYFTGGCTAGAPSGSCTAMTTSVESLQVYNNYSGSAKQYNTGNLFTTDRYGGSAVAYGGKLYLAGGCSGTIDCEASPGTATFQGDTQYADIAADGSLTWHTGTSFPASAVRGFGCMAAIGGYLYYMGGRDGSTAAYSTVYYTQLTSGVPGSWTAASGGIGDTAGQAAQTKLNPGCAVFNNKIYVTGGSDTTPTYTTSTYISPSLASGGNIAADSWTSASNNFATGRRGMVTVAYGSTLYVLGGYDGTNFLVDTQYAPITATGDLGAWTYGTSLPTQARQASGFAANGYLYVFGGRSATTTCTASTYVAPILGYPPGSSSRYGIGVWSQTGVKYTGARYGVAAAYNNGKAYLLGGICNATLTGANSVVSSTLQAQPQISSYSIEVNADTNVFPSKYLMNGIDNGIGAQWVLTYQSSTTANNAWGNATTVNPVTLGTPGTYTPLDGSGVNTNTTVGAQYYYLFITVDASQAFGYPEDVTRGPTIADLTLQFTSDPGKRLMHGRTFTGGIQQPDDAPF